MQIHTAHGSNRKVSREGHHDYFDPMQSRYIIYAILLRHTPKPHSIIQIEYARLALLTNKKGKKMNKKKI